MSATFSAAIAAGGEAVTQAGFEYKAASASAWTTTAAAGVGSITLNAAGLTTGAEYTVRAYAEANGNKLVGQPVKFVARLTFPTLDFTTGVDQSGEGYRWVEEIATLTLTDFDYTATDPIGIKLPEYATVILKGENRITAGDSTEPSIPSVGLFCEGSPYVRGNGSLVATAGEGEISSGVMTAFSLNIQDGSLTGVGKSAGVTVNGKLFDNGNYVKGTINVIGGTLIGRGGTAQNPCAMKAEELDLDPGVLLNCNIGANTGYADAANHAGGVIYEGTGQSTVAKDVKIYLPAPPGLLNNPLTQEKVDAAFGAGNATLSGSTITLNNSIVVNTPVTFDGVTATLILNGNTITGARGADSATTAEGGLSAVWLQNEADVTVDGTKAGSALIGGRGGDHTNNGNGGNGGTAVDVGDINDCINRFTMTGGEIIGGSGGYTNSSSKGGSGGTALYADTATVTLNGVTVRGGGIAQYVDATGGHALQLGDGTFSLNDVTAIGGKGTGTRGDGDGVQLQSETASLTIDGGRYVGEIGLKISDAASTVKILAGEFITTKSYNSPASILRGRWNEDVPVGDLFDLTVPEGQNPKVLLLGGVEVDPADLTANKYTETIRLIKSPEPTATVALSGTEKYYYDFAAAWAAATGDGNTGGATVKLLNDINQKQYFLNNDAPITVPQDKTVTLDLNGFAIDRGLTEPTGNGSVLMVDGGTLTLDDTSDAQTGKVTGGYSDDCGGGVLVRGNFVLQGGAITGNSAYMGSGVAVQVGSAELRGGSITGNQNDLNPYSPVDYGGGLYVSIGAALESGGAVPVPTVKLSGGITIDGNTGVDGKPSNVTLELMPGDASGGASPADDVASVLTIDGALTGKIGVGLMRLDENLDATPVMGTVANADPLYNSGTIPAADAARVASDISTFGVGLSADSTLLLLMDADIAAVAAAKAAVVDGSVTVAHGATQADKTAAVQSYVNSLLTGNAAGVTATVTHNSDTGKYDVALSKSTASDSKSIAMTVTESDDPDIATVAAAKAAAENAAYATATQAAAPTEAAAKAHAQAVATTAVNNSAVTITVNSVSYTAPVAGTAQHPNGTNGSYAFTVTVAKGAQSQTTAQKTLAITATPFTGVTDAQAVAAAKAAIVDGTVNVASGATQAEKTAAVQSYVSGLLAATPNAAGVTATVTYNSGAGNYDVAFIKGSATGSKTLAMSVNESADPDADIVEAAKAAAANASYTAPTQAAAPTEAAAKAHVQAIAATAVNNSAVTVTVNSVSYTAPVAGTAQHPNGTNGSYAFTVTVAKGTQSQTTAQITVAITATAYSSGGGGSESGGSTPPVTKPTEPVTGSTQNKATVDDKGNAAVSITDKNITEAIANAKAAAAKKGVNAGDVTVVIQVTTDGKAATGVSVNLPKVVQEQVIGSRLAKVELVIDRPDLAIGMNLAAVTALNRQANADVQITASRADAAALSAEAKAVIGGRPAYNLEATYQGGSKSVTSFGTGTVSVEIPYTLQRGESAGSICAVYVDGNGKAAYLLNSGYDARRQTLVFTTNHFSVYGVGLKADPATFADTSTHWAKDSIDFVLSRGLINGTSATAFDPDGAITRGTLATALGRLSGVDVSGYKASSFGDVRAGSPDMGYIEWAGRSNIMAGVGGGKFAPDSLVTREQMAVIMERYATAIGYKLPEVHAAQPYADNAKIGAGSAVAVKRLQMAGILSAKTGNLFDPQGMATRAEVSALLKRFVELTAFSDTAQGWTLNDSGSWMYFEAGKPVTGAKSIGGTAYTFNSHGEAANAPTPPANGGDSAKQAAR